MSQSCKAERNKAQAERDKTLITNGFQADEGS